MTPIKHTQSAAKDYPNQNIKKGESFFSWQHRGYPVERSKMHPTPLQLAPPGFLKDLYILQAETAAKTPSPDTLEDEISTVQTALEEMRDEQQEKFDNIPDNFKEADTAQKILERIESLEEAIRALEDIDIDFSTEKMDDEKQNHADELWAEVKEALSNIED